MTAREELKAKPETVQIVLKARMTTMAMLDPVPDWDNYARVALDEWNASMAGNSLDVENEVAQAMIEWMRKRPLWGKILREGAN